MHKIRLVIDIGTNTVRLLAAIKDGAIETLEKRLVTTRLGMDAGADGRLHLESIARTVQGAAALLKWGRARYPKAPVHVFATSALREAPNRSDFTDLLHRRTGLDVHVVSGEEEADLAFAGAVETDGRAGVIDIGGGSTELMIGEAGRIEYVQSVKTGVVRLSDMFDVSGRVGEKARAALEAAVRAALREFTLLPASAGTARWHGVGGTVTALAAMEARIEEYTPQAIQGLGLSHGAVCRWYKRLLTMPLDEKRRLTGLPRDRADVITGGACILVEFMERWGVDALIVSDRDNLEGYLKRYGRK
jgi:exopolyphosphatase/guanosine-5'-triphosphate,3'-diphosphate pyrophosphatase